MIEQEGGSDAYLQGNLFLPLRTLPGRSKFKDLVE